MDTAGSAHPSIATVSHSRLDLFHKCPAAFWHAYVNHTPPDGYERIESWTGSLVHQVLEEALRGTLEKHVPDPVATLARFEELWDTTHGPHVLLVRRERPAEEFRANGRRWLRDYLDDAWPFVQDSTPLHIEEEVTFPLSLPDGRPIQFRGVMDRVDRLGDGRLRLMDYKTGNWVPDFKDPRDAFQLALYWNGLVWRYPETPGGVLVWHYLQHRQSRRVDPDGPLVAHALKWATETAADVQGRIERESAAPAAFPARTGPLCRWCSYGYACEANPYRKDAPAPRLGAPAGPTAPT